MKKYIDIALIYAIAAMIGGVFYREFTKLNGFTGETMLSKVHAHLFLLGMVIFLIVALFSTIKDLENEKHFKRFMKIYNIGVPLTVIMMLVRGVTQVLSTPMSKGLDASISGIAGIGHILAGLGIIFLLLSLRKISKA